MGWILALGVLLTVAGLVCFYAAAAEDGEGSAIVAVSIAAILFMIGAIVTLVETVTLIIEWLF